MQASRLLQSKVGSSRPQAGAPPHTNTVAPRPVASNTRLDSGTTVTGLRWPSANRSLIELLQTSFSPQKIGACPMGVIWNVIVLVELVRIEAVFVDAIRNSIDNQIY